VQHVLGKKALSRARFPLDQHGQWAAGEHLEPLPQLGHRRRSPPDYGAFLVRRTERFEARNARPAVRGLTVDSEGVAHRSRANARDGKRVFAPDPSAGRRDVRLFKSEVAGCVPFADASRTNTACARSYSIGVASTRDLEKADIGGCCVSEFCGATNGPPQRDDWGAPI